MTTPAATATDLTVVFVDLVRFTSLTDVHGDVAGADAATALEAVARTSLQDCARLVKTLGDGVLFSANEADVALRCSSEIMEGIHGLGMGLDARCGGVTGPVVAREGDLYGSTVNMASRIASVADPGSMVTTRGLAQAATGLGLAVVPLGHREVKGYADVIELFQLALCSHQADFLVDPVCGMRVDPAQASAQLWSVGEDQVAFCSTECEALYRASPERYS